jgi:F0F1-type ATP synthase assembly protein I
MEEPNPQSDPGSSSPPPAESPVSPGAIELLTLGLAGALSLVAGGGLGYLIDDWVGTSPVFTLLGLAFGIVVAVLMTINRVRRYL